jgi:acyl-CoA hydrolase
VIAYADGFDSPRSAPPVVARAAQTDDLEILVGWMPEPRGWLDNSDATGLTMFAGYAAATAVSEGRLAYLPVRLSATPHLVAGRLRPEVAVVSAVRRGSDLVFGQTVGWGPAVAKAADVVVVEVDENGTDLGGPLVPGNIVATIPRPPGPDAPSVPRPPDQVDHQIGRLVASLVPEDATLQFGPGGVADAIVGSLDRPVHIWSGLVSDAVVELDRRGLLVGPAVAAYTWGGDGIAALADRGQLRLVGVETSHDITTLSSIERFVSCNTALEVGLDGAVNVERAGQRWVAGIGGHADFCAGASRSVGGLSVIALRSTTRAGTSTIVKTVSLVSTPRCDVDVVVTEHGIADLRGLDDRARAERIATVAAPAHRPGLLDAARNS